MRKNLLYLVALMCSFSLSVMAQDSTSCSATEVLLTMTDSYGDGWDSGTAVVSDAAGNELFSGTVDDNTATATLCLEDGVYAIAVGGSSYLSEMSFTIGDLSGGAGSYEFLVGDSLGCTNPEATNYEPIANIDDASCLLEGCTDSTAYNFDADANVEDNSCEAVVLGCTDAQNGATNYNPAANTDDESCTYPTCEVGFSELVVTTAGSGNEVGLLLLTASNDTLIDVEPGDLSSYSTSDALEVCFVEDASYTIHMYDSYGDGWQGGTFSIVSCDGAFTQITSGLLATDNAGDSLLLDFSPLSCDDLVLGCMDSLADNYSADATHPSNLDLCNIPGCTSSNTLEYSEVATYQPDSLECTLIVEGCTDSLALNYAEAANVDDASCVFACSALESSVFISIGSSSFASEMSWDITNDLTGEVEFSGLGDDFDNEFPICLEAGSYTFNSIDSYGDGWNGATYSVSVLCDTEIILADNGGAVPGGDGESESFDLMSCDSYVFGCTDPLATNYDAAANMDANENCEYELSLSCADALALSSGDVYPGTIGQQEWFSFVVDTLSIVDVSVSSTTSISATILSSCGGDTVVSPLDAGTYYVNVAQGFGSGAEYDFSLTSAALVAGCTDPLAGNYNSDANLEDNSCDYSCSGIEVELSLNFGTWASEISWAFVNAEGLPIVQGGDYDNALDNNTSPSFDLCLQAGSEYTFIGYDSYGDGWNSGGNYSIISSTCIDSLQLAGGGVEGSSSSETFTALACDDIVFGCTDVTAFNYDASANTDDASCEAVVLGCTDPLAGNYDPSANTEDGGCVANCTDVSVSILPEPGYYLSTSIGYNLFSEEMSYFNDSTLNIELIDSTTTMLIDSVFDDNIGLIIDTTYVVSVTYDTTLVVTPDSAIVQNVLLSYASTPSSTLSLVDTICLAPGVYGFDALSLYSWSTWGSATYSINALCDTLSGVLTNNGGETPNSEDENDYFSVGNCDEYIIGCMDESAFNYDDQADTQGECIPVITGCTNSNAVNYNEFANTDDGLCFSECLDVYVTIDAGTYASGANSYTITNAVGSDVSSWVGPGVSVSDVIEDTLCLGVGSYSFNSFQLYGNDWSDDTYSVSLLCPDSDSTSSMVVLADNAGEVPSDSTSESFSVIPCSDIDYGCMDEIAENYSEIADVDDGSCTYIYGCTDTTASNYNADATVDDSSCEFACNGVQLVANVSGGSWASEMSWDLTSADGEELVSGTGSDYSTAVPFCVEAGEYTFTADDSYGDGWNGATFSVSTICDGILIPYFYNDSFTSGSQATETFSAIKCSNMALGCTEENSINFDASAEYNDGSCIAIVEGCTDASAANYDAEANVEDGSCVSACTDIAVTVIGGGGTIDSWTEFSFYAEEMTYFDDSSYVVDAVDTSYVVSLDSSLVDSAWAYSNDTAMVVSYDTTLVVTLDSALVQNVLLSASIDDMWGSDDNDDVYSDTICIPEGSYVFDPSSTSSYTSSWYSDTFSVDAVCEDGSAILENNGGESPNPNGDNFSVDVVPCSAMTLGCSDSTAFNFDSAATHDDGSCVPTVLGCMDASAVNYNEDANVDDGLCADECIDVSINLDGGAYGISTSNLWTLYNAADAVVASGSSDTYGVDNTSDIVCLPVGSYTFEANSSSTYSSTWGDDTYSVDLGCGSFDSAMVVSYDTALVVTIDSALVDSAWVFTSDSSEVVSVDTSLVVTDNTSVVVLASNGGESPAVGNMESFTVISCDDVVFGCTDSIAENFNADATVNDGSCEFIFGCQIDYALNYDSTATVSNDTCYFDASLIAPAPGVTLDLVQDDSLSLSWDIALDLVGDTVEDYYVYFSSNPNDLGSSDFESDFDSYTGSVVYYLGSSDTTSLVVQYADMYNWFIESGYQVNDLVEVHWWVSDVRSYSSTGYPDYNAQYTLNDQAFTSSHSINLTFTGVLGCTDATALNFDADATVDDGSCVLPCTDDESSVNVSVEGGFYPGEMTWNLTSDASGEAVLEGAGSDFATENPLCLDAGSYTFNSIDSYGDGWNGATYSVSLSCGDNEFVIANNGGLVPDGDGVSEMFDIASCDSYVLGCTDSAYVEFNPLANIYDGSCSELACTGDVVTLTLYDSYGDGGGELTVGDVVLTNPGSEASVLLCVDLTACTEVTYASTDTWSSENSWEVTNVNGAVLASNGPASGSFGTCAVLGCTDATADNYNADADEDDGSCIFYGCNNPIADNYDSNATDDDGSCILPCEEGLSQVDLLVTTDAYSSQIDYTISSTDGQSYAVDLTNNNNTTVVERYCFENGSDVSFQLNESAYGIILGGYQIYVCEELEFVNFDINEAGSYTEEFMVACGDITGCMDSSAVNFNALATISDAASCEFPFVCDGETVEVSISTGSFASEMDWTITDVDGNVVASNDDDYSDDSDYATNVCLEAEAEFDFNAIDSYGDGWNGGAFVLNGSCGELASGTAAAAGVTTGSTEAFAFSTCAPTNEVTCQTIDLPQGWSMFSTSMMADDMDLAAALTPIVDDVIIAKNNAGNAYLVEYAYNGVGDVLIGQGYQIKTSQATSFDMCGIHQLPEDNPIALGAGWNMVGYLRNVPADAAAVFADINATNNLVIAKDYSGNAYLPQFSYNGIGDMHPGQGYQLKTVEADVLQYNASDVSYRASNVEVTNNTVSHFAKVAATDNNMTVVFEDAAWDVLPTTGAEIAAFDKAGNLIGSASYTSPLTVLTVWGDDATTEAKEGSVLTETVTFKVWSNDLTSTFEVAKWTQGSANYDVNTINVAGAIVTNVLTSAIAVERELVKVINVLGQEVDSNERSFRGEVLFNVYNDGTVEKVVK